MARIRILYIIVAAAIVSSSGCARQEGMTVLAKVGNKVISLKDMKERIEKLPANYKSSISRNKERFLDDLIVEELFYEEAVRQGLHKDTETRDVIREAKKKILIARLIKKEIEDNLRISEEDLKKYYDEHKEDFRTPELWRASHILVAAEGEAQEIRDGVNNAGWNFEEAARARSQDATAKRGGDIGYFTRGQLVPEFEEACIRLNVGDPCQIVRTQFGYHVIKLTDRKPPRVEEFDKAKPSIEDRLKRTKRKELFNGLVERLKEKYKVEIAEGALKAFQEPSASQGPGPSDSGAPGGTAGEHAAETEAVASSSTR